METVGGPVTGPDGGCGSGAAMERFGGGGMALLPWTRQILTVLWEQLRLLVQVIYYTFMSVFQMFRFEVHVRITDETGQHIQHMSSASGRGDLFSLFEGEGGVMVGGCGEEALLSSLRADELCCGLSSDDGLFLGRPPAAWNMGFPADWNIFVSGADASGQEKLLRAEGCEEERSSAWSSEEEQQELDSEESNALWESLSRSSDPYNPFFFSACISSSSRPRSADLKEAAEPGEAFVSRGGEERGGAGGWVSRSDSDSSWSSWSSSDGSGPDMDEENQRLLELFSSPDPYNPMSFTACTSSSPPTSSSRPPPPPSSEEDVSRSPSSEDDEEEQLWKSLSPTDDPYHPLNFQACIQSSPTAGPRPGQGPPLRTAPPREGDTQTVSRKKPSVAQRRCRQHSHPDTRLVPWRRPGQEAQASPRQQRQDHTPPQKNTPHKRVRFSPRVEVHVMRTWPFARQKSRKGPWEELARDRDRFQRRIRDSEQILGHCLTPSHREKVRARLDDDAQR